MKSERSCREPHVLVVLLSVALVSLTTLAGCSSVRRTAQRDDHSTGPEARGLPVGSSTHTISVDGTSRTYRTYVPSGLDATTPVPLVVMIHGGFGSAEQAEQKYGWDARADAGRFVVLYPDGTDHAWNAGACCGAPSLTGVDDVGFIEQAVAATGRGVSVDPRRTFVTGMSNGAMMAYALICRTDLFAAAAPVAGAQMLPCVDPSPVSLLHIHGNADTSVPLDGSPGDGRGRVSSHTPIPDVIASWRRVDGCDGPSTSTDGPVTTSTATCDAGRAVTLVVVAGAGHQWPGSQQDRPAVDRVLGVDPPSQALDATDLIWSFFAAHPRPSTAGG